MCPIISTILVVMALLYGVGEVSSAGEEFASHLGDSGKNSHQGGLSIFLIGFILICGWAIAIAAIVITLIINKGLDAVHVARVLRV